MTIGEKIRAYAVEPVLATLTISLLANLFSWHQLADFMHTEAKDILALMLVLLASALAIWVGLFWVSNTPFGMWLIEKGDFDGIQTTYVYAIVGIFSATLGCIVSAYLDSTHLVLQAIAIWFACFGLYTLPFLLNNTRMLLKLHAVFSTRPRKVSAMDRPAEK